MNTKWNSLGFRPGLVGRHFIGVDPYYFTYQAEKLGYHSKIILNGRIVNDGMGEFIADAAVKEMILSGIAVKGANIVVMGLSFKENCPDIRNSKVIDIIKRLSEFGIKTLVVDPWASKDDALKEYDVDLKKIDEVSDADCIIFAVAHDCFRSVSLSEISKMYRNKNNKVLIDVKGIYDMKEALQKGFSYWRL